ncbi:hypothetical protein KJ671_04035 [Patescibacteria group bacterium]|nr:hypothetical protein [Patescibacteria group bacterium]
MEKLEHLAKILGVEKTMLEKIDKVMTERTGKSGVLEKVELENEKIMEDTLRALNSNDRSAEHVKGVLRQTILSHEKQFLAFLEIVEGKNIFEKSVFLAKKIAKVSRGFFLKKEYAKKILRERPSQKLLDYLKASNIDEVLEKYDVIEIFSSLRFVETDEWMHETFEVAYSKFTPDNFEEREIEVKVLGDVWLEVAKKFVAKKHHNVSHLKEFGVVFVNPIFENIPGKFLRDFALILHYFYEIKFYSNLFESYFDKPDFAERLKSLLRGDVKDVFKVEDGEWLIIQRYLAKVDPNDTRLFLPRVNPESLYWLRGERDLALFSPEDSDKKMDLKIWNNLDWVGGIFKDGIDQIVSFDLEDNAMSLVSFMEGKNETFNYHQREAMWTKIFSEYVGGEEEMEKLLVENFDKGTIKF